jgi:hypothetical protein
VAAALQKLLHAIERGDINSEDSVTSLQSIDRSDGITELGVRSKQPFDQTATIKALTALAASGNLDSSGGLSLLFKCMRRYLVIAPKFRRRRE